MKWTISKKLILITLLAILLPASIGSMILYREIEENVAYTKLNDLMNIIDARYIHVLDYFKQQELIIDKLGEDHYLHEKLQNYYDTQSSSIEYEKGTSLQSIYSHLVHLQQESQLDWHAMKKDKEAGMSLKQVFGRDVKWDMYRTEERLYRIHELLVIGVDGKVLTSTNRENIGIDMSNSDIFKHGKEDLYIKDVYEDRDGSTVMAFTSPLIMLPDFSAPDYNSDGFLGIIVLKVNTDFLSDLMTGDIGNQLGGKLFFAGYTPSTDFYMINKEGYMITQSKVLKGKRDTILKQQSKTIPWERCVNEHLSVREAQEFYLNYDGIEVGGSSMCVFDMKWTMVVEQNKDEILTLFTSIEKIMTLIGLVMALATSLLLFFLTRKAVIEPINKLSYATEQLQKGDYDVQVDINNDDEVGRLANSFNNMAEDIRRTNQELQLNNQELEERVEWRTKELSNSNGLLVAEVKGRKKAQLDAEQANKAKSQFLATMSHEIRTPMNGVLGMLRLLDKTSVNEKQQHYIDTATSSSQILLAVINDILDFSKLEADKLELESIPFDLHEMLKESVAFWTNEASKKEIALRCSVESSVPMWVKGDPTRLRQVLNNLINNAIKFTEQGEIVAYLSMQRGGRILFGIKDGGIGMSETQQHMLFNAFTQVDGSHTRKYGGTGLGLAICQKLITAMGGEISVSSEPNKGADFHFDLALEVVAPLPSETAASLATEAINEVSGSTEEREWWFAGKRILLVEDNEINQEVAQEILTDAGFEVDICDNGSLAVEAVQNNNYDLVFMDIQMPVMDGFEACRLIRALGGCYDNLPIIAMTAHALSGDADKSLEAGMNAHITKPFDPSKLFIEISNWMTPGDKPTQLDSDTKKEASSENIPELPGIDVEEGLRCFGGRWPFYKRLLRLFRDSEGNVAEMIKMHIAKQEWSDANDLVHRLKGVSGQIHAQEVYQITVELEIECKNHNSKIAAQIASELAPKLNKVINGLGSLG